VENDILKTIAARHCKRAFLGKEVPRELLEQVLQTASNAPSSKNTQSWQATVLRAPQQKELSKILCEKFDAGIVEKPDYHYLPDPMPEEFMKRARDCGYSLYALKGIERRDVEKRKLHERENYKFFGAPVCIYFHLPSYAKEGSFLDLGFFMQNVMLGLVGVGLGSCPQFSVTKFTQTIKQFLNLKDQILVSGMSVGYIDPNAKVNTFIPKRIPPNEFIHWVE